MKKTAVVGLGIIGGSICRALTKAGYYVAGSDLDEKVRAYALEEGFIREEAKSLTDYDTVFLAVPPRAAVAILDRETFRPDALVADICGVKGAIGEAVYAKERNYRYIGLHPMAGKETSGISSSSAELFAGANLLLVSAPGTKQSAVTEILDYAKAMGFGKITPCTAEEHDKKIALTSQLAHLVSNAYVKSPEVKNCEGFTGGSFQDMTRIAGVDEKMWTQLYMFNRANILAELDGLIAHLEAYRRALSEGDENALSEALLEGRLSRESIKREKH